MYKGQNTIELPVPFGTPVYRVITTCGDFCLFQKKRLESITDFDIECSDKSPCHTRLHCVRELILDYKNLEVVLKEWGIKVFATPEAAAAAGLIIVEENREIMRKHGFLFDDSGYAKKERRT